MKLKKKSQKQEKNIAEVVGGDVVVASGAKWGAKGDIRTDDYLIEAKYTNGEYYPLHLDTWNKIKMEALNDKGRIPLMIVDVKDKRFIVFEACDFDVEDNLPSNEGRVFRLRYSLCDMNDEGSYVYMQKVKLGGTLLCIMLLGNFFREYGGIDDGKNG